MYISSFRIDGFGILSDVQVDDLPPGLSIFLGRNEAGKSTCLEFLRSCLAGYPAPRSREARRSFAPLHGGQAGGSLVLRLPGQEAVHLTRRPGPGGGSLNLCRADGTSLAPELWQQIMQGISREVYCNVFGFSLSELERLESLSADEVRSALYGASFGPGLRAPGEAIRLLDRQCDEIFRRNGSNPPLNAALRQLEEIRSRIEEVTLQCAGFDAKARELAEKREALNALRQHKGTLEEERRLLERRLGVWRQWDEWRVLGLSLERIPSTSPTFPENGPARLARLQEARETCERQVAAQNEKLARLRQRHQAITVDLPLLQSLPQLRRLAERKSGFRQALGALPGQKENCRRAEADLARELARLGPDWDCARIRATDRSLFAREDLEKQAREMSASALAHQAAVDSLAQANRDVELAERDITTARNALALLPAPVAALGDEARDELRHTLARLEDNRRQLPGRERALQNARTAFARAFGPLRLTMPVRPGQAASAEDAEAQGAALDNLLDRQQEALELAGEMQTLLQEAQEASLAVQQAQEQVDAVKRKMDELREAQRSWGGPSRENLDTRTTALRQLRALASSIGTEQDRLRELDERIATEKAPSPVKSLPLMLLGLILLAGGMAMLGAHWFYGINEFALTPTFTVPITLWSGYLVLTCGVAFLAGGVPRSGPEAKQHKLEMEQLRSRRETCALHLAELEEQARQLCLTAEIESADPITLEATEVLLEREREQCFHEERARQDMDALKQEMGLARAQVGMQQGKAHEAEGRVQQTRRRWHELMLSLRVGNVPSPEGAAAFFARAESARMALTGVTTAQAELHSLNEAIEQMENRMCSLPPVAERLAPPPPITPQDEQDAPAAQEDTSVVPQAILPTANSMALTDAVRLVLESCREADAAREQRIKATAALQNHENELARAQTRQRQGVDALRIAEERLANARENWSHCLQGLGLGEELDPETVREGFNYMENCLAAESALERARSEQAQSLAELAALREPLATLLESLGRTPLPGEEGDTGDIDWLQSLDTALSDAEAADRAQAEKTRLAGLMAEEEDGLRAGEAALAEARHNENDLLALAGAQDAEDFLRMAAQREEERSRRQRRADLEDALKLAAGKLPLADFLASFQEEEQDSQEKRHILVQNELEQLQTEEERLAAGVAELDAGVAALSRTDDLSSLRQQEALLLESMERMSRTWARNSLAREILREAKLTFERERQPEVIRQASEIFARITGQRWRGISASLEDSSLAILPQQGEPLAPEALSRGAQEQAYLALRLAYIKSHASHATPLPIIMDEVLVNFDPERAERTARAFASLCEGDDGQTHQLLYFTCQPHMVEILRAAAPGAALYRVEDGKINAG